MAGDDANGVVEDALDPGGRRRLAGVALVANPGVAIVVVASFAGPLGKGGRRGRHHRARRRGQPVHDRHRVLRFAGRRHVLEAGHALGPRRLGLAPGACRNRRGGGSRAPSSTSTRSCRSPSARSSSSSSAAPSRGRAAPRPTRARSFRPTEAATHPPSRRPSSIGSSPNPAASASRALRLPRPATTAMLRRTTARPGCDGSASASRHSTIPSSVTHRLRQISDPRS